MELTLPFALRNLLARGGPRIVTVWPDCGSRGSAAVRAKLVKARECSRKERNIFKKECVCPERRSNNMKYDRLYIVS